MKFQRILDALYKQPLAITTAGHATLDAIMRSRLSKGSLKADAGTDFFGNELPDMEVQGGIAIIPVCGPLIQHADMLETMCGATSYEWLGEKLREAGGRPDVRGIILRFDTPGGQCTGLPELAELIAEIASTKPVYAFTDSMMCSAGYHLAAGCTGIFSTGSAFIGSIGVIIGFIDVSKAFEMQGLKAEYITSGDLKATGREGTALTDEQRAYLQELVDESFAVFSGWVKTHRINVTGEEMRGQMFHGNQAAEAGLVDGLVSNLDEVIQFLSAA